MKRLYGSHNSLIVGHLKNVLEAQGIDCVVRNEHLSGAAGELPPNECWPEIWIIEEALYARAKALVEEFLHGEAGERLPWTCPGCGERLEGQFSECWNCGQGHPEV